MSEFSIYFELGVQHILDWEGYDHVLFVIALCASYLVRQWREVIVLATAFTLGHSLTLGLYTLDYITVSTRIVEVFIPITILLTASHNFFKKANHGFTPNWNYLFALVFGLIHGLGFANFFKAMMGGSEGVTFPLFAFNVGIEVAQIMVIVILFVIQWVGFRFIKMSLKSWNYGLSTLAILLSLKLLFDLITT